MLAGIRSMPQVAVVSATLTLLTSIALASEIPAVLTGRFEMEDSKTASPKSLSLRLWSVDGGKEITVDCSIDSLSWSCSAPPGKFDAEVHAIGYVPLYLWDFVLEPSRTRDLGSIRLVRGAAISGKVVEHGFALKGARVELLPAGTLIGDNARRNRLRGRQTKTEGKGIFTFLDVGSGTYTIAAQKDGYSAVSRGGIRVEEPLDLHVEPITLTPLAKLHLFISPPMDYYGQPWSVRLDRAITGSMYQETVRKGTASLAGYWDDDRLDASDYRLEIVTSRGEQITSREVNVHQDTSLNLVIESIRIQGRITQGGEPVSAGVALIWKDGSRVAFRSNKAGEFSGTVPHEGTWRATVRLGSQSSELHLPAVTVKRRPEEETATVRIELPAGVIKGKVVDDEGRGVRASVLVFRDGALELSAMSSDDGEFRIVGIETGQHQINAMAKSGSSGLMPVEVGEQEGVAITLMIQSTVMIRGTVSDSAGNPIPGALVHYITPSSTRLQAGTGLAGDFSISVARGAPTAILVVASGLPRKLLTYSPLAEAEQRLPIIIGPRFGLLHVKLKGGAPPWPFITRDGVLFFWLPALFLPSSAGPPPEFQGDRFTFEIEPGTYSVCPEQRMSERCATKTVPQGGEATATGSSSQWR